MPGNSSKLNKENDTRERYKSIVKVHMRLLTSDYNTSIIFVTFASIAFPTNKLLFCLFIEFCSIIGKSDNDVQIINNQVIKFSFRK